MDDSDAISKARSLLRDAHGNPTLEYTAYLRHQSEYNEKIHSYNAAQQSARASPLQLQRWPIVGKEYSDAVNDALRKWIALGYKQEVENALNVLQRANL